jgi:diguanylate cyclase (GGDEF)-like protein
MWIITIRSPSNRPVNYRIKPGKNTLGRKPDNDIVISDQSASRMHAEIFYQDNLLVIYDLKSTNGTFVNTERVKDPVVLRSGDQIRIGQLVASVTFHDEDSPSELISALTNTRPLTRDLLLESVDKHAVLLYEVANRLNTILDLKTAMQEVSRLIQVSMDADKCEVILADAFDRLGELGFPTSIAQQAIDQRSVIILPDLPSQSGQSPSQSALLLHIRSVLCVPVISEGEVAALIYVYKTDPAARSFDENDVQVAVAISHQTALIIQRANLIERARVLEISANVDSLTGLNNRNHFLALAEGEFQRARRFQHPLSIIMLDLDQLKPVNDSYGHSAGDQALQTVAARCNKQVRGIDIVGRYGGDEFILLLVETEAKAALTVAKRVCQSISDVPVDTERGPINISVSLGIASLNSDCPNLTALINRADDALYMAKKAGKNQVLALD